MLPAGIAPVPNLQRKAAIAAGGPADHAGEVWVEAIDGFKLEGTIFETLEGAAPRFVMRTRVGKETHWKQGAAQRVQEAYESCCKSQALPEISPALLRFMMEECDFDTEHADGSFLEHLYFCFEYSARHLPAHSPIVMLLHSILGTGTNTFAMEANKIPLLRPLLSEQEWQQVEAFPSILRLLYDLPLRKELQANRERFSKLESVRFHRVIDNASLSLSAEEFWIQLNYQLIHLIDFLPVANWAAHANDTAFVLFRELYELLEESGRRAGQLRYTPTSARRTTRGEEQSVAAWLTTLIPAFATEKMAARALRRFSKRIGHSLDFELVWAG